MDHDIKVPGITHVSTHVNAGEGCSGITAYVHHDLAAGQAEKLLHAVELLLPALIKLAAEL